MCHLYLVLPLVIPLIHITLYLTLHHLLQKQILLDDLASLDLNLVTVPLEFSPTKTFALGCKEYLMKVHFFPLGPIYCIIDETNFEHMLHNLMVAHALILTFGHSIIHMGCLELISKEHGLAYTLL